MGMVFPDPLYHPFFRVQAGLHQLIVYFFSANRALFRHTFLRLKERICFSPFQTLSELFFRAYHNIPAPLRQYEALMFTLCNIPPAY
jgi:hypothetical protein